MLSKLRAGGAKPGVPGRSDDPGKLLGRLDEFRSAMAALSPFASTEGEDLIELLCDWAVENSTQVRARLAKLDELRSKLEGCPLSDLTAWLNVVHEWIGVALQFS